MAPAPRIPRTLRFSRSLLWSTALHGGALAVLVAAGMSTLSRPRGRSTPDVVALEVARHQEVAPERPTREPEVLPDLAEAEPPSEDPWLPLDDPSTEPLEDPAAPRESDAPADVEAEHPEDPRTDPERDPFAHLDPRTPIARPGEAAEPAEVEPTREAIPVVEPPVEPPSEPRAAAVPSGVEADERAPRLLDGDEPEYPLLARRQGWQGEVLLALVISPTGRVTATRVLESSGHVVLDEAAAEAVRAWTFEPARHGDEAVEVEIEKRFRFDLGD